ncbi:MAG: hypothetical protein RLZZ135_1811 [Cyanobacteriota bacterium]|jgi:hypothetical protein
MFKEITAILAVALTFYGFLPYIRSILRNETKPHVFSWVIWGVTTFIVFFAQHASRGGIGSWLIGISGIITSFIALLAYLKRSDTTITTADWVFLIAAFSALPFWFFASDPLWAVMILTIVDTIGFAPTVRKAYAHPHEEKIGLFGIFIIRNLLVILALEHYSFA